MTVISNSVEIRCTPEEAFDYLSDHRNELEWNPGIESIDKLTDGPVGLGTKYLAKWKSAPKAIEVETIAYDRPHDWSVHNSGPVGGLNACWSVRSGAGRVRVTSSPSASISRMWQAILRRMAACRS